MISKSKFVELLSNEYRKINTEYRELYESSSEAIKYELEACVQDWAIGVYEKLVVIDAGSAAGILITGLKTEEPIKAIKTLRHSDTRLGLKDAKDIVEAMRTVSPIKHHKIPKHLFEPTQERLQAGASQSQDMKDTLVDLRRSGFEAELIE